MDNDIMVFYNDDKYLKFIAYIEDDGKLYSVHVTVNKDDPHQGSAYLESMIDLPVLDNLISV